MADTPISFRDPLYAALDAKVERKLGLPAGLQAAIREHGERTNADKVSSAGAKTVYQITPATRELVLKKYGIDPYLSTENAAEAAGLLLKESLDRNQGDVETAVREYHGGTNRKAWGPINNAYAGRVLSGMNAGQDDALLSDLQALKASKATTPAAAPANDDSLISDLKAWKKQGGIVQSDADKMVARIPGMEPGFTPTATPQQPTSIADTALGAAEAALTTATGATGGALGMLGGTLKGLAEQILSGQFGTAEAANLVEQEAMRGAQALTYEPRTPSGQRQAAAVGDAMANLIPVAPVLPGIVPAGGARAASPIRTTAQAGIEGAVRDVMGQPAAAATGRAIDTATRVADLGAKKITTLPRRALEALRSEPESTSATPGTMGSVGAAGTDMALQRQALADSFPVPLRLTKGQASRNSAQLKFEVEAAKMPEEGVPLRQRLTEQNEAILNNFDTWIDQTGAEAPNLRAVGVAVDKALVQQASRDKVKMRAAYKEAEKAGEMEAPVALNGLVEHLNESAPDAATAPLLDVARRRAVQLGIAADNDGVLTPLPTPLKNAERYRQAISRATDYEATNVRQSTIIKGLVDEATDGMGGNLYRQARALRARNAQNYENRATISKLLKFEKGTTDRKVAFEDVFDHAILKGSLDDVRNVRRVLQRGGEEGQQAWRELQGQTLTYLRDQATKSVSSDSAGSRIVSAPALTKALRDLDVDGRLDFVFGKKGAQNLRDIADLAEYVKTVPPDAAINHSNTAATLAGLVDVAITGALGGTPAPITTAARLALKHIKDVKLRRRISDALNEAEKRRAPGRRNPAVVDPGARDAQQLPPKTLH